MRYARADRLIQLALEMQAARDGLSLTDIETRFNVSRRTAIRLRDAVIAAFPGASEVPSTDRTKRWRLGSGSTRTLSGVTADELAALESAATLLARENRLVQAEELRGLAAKVRATIADALLHRLDPDASALAEAEGLAFRPGPRPLIPERLIHTLRTAIKAGQKLAFHYSARTNTDAGPRIVHPLGFLHGHRHYLVALKEEAGQPLPRPRLYSLPQMTEVRLLPESFSPPPGFSLAEFLETQFGVFSEPPHAIIWRFSPAAAATARQFRFHPSQSFEDQPDGSLIVRFHAGGLVEMAWHLICWGRHVEVLSPPQLKALMPPTPPDWPVLP